MDQGIERWIKTECGRAKYAQLAQRRGIRARLRLVWFVVIAVLRDVVLSPVSRGIRNLFRIERWIKTECGRAKYAHLAQRHGILARLRLAWFVAIAVLRDVVLSPVSRGIRNLFRAA